jgi:ABC-type phosphate/phosphonate transport system substrate-binding protein
MARLASLPMYDLVELRPATDRLWASLSRELRQCGLEAPPVLSRDVDLEPHWLDPRLLLSQTCGYPLTHALSGRVTVVATPHYRAPGCQGPRYRSAIVVPASSPLVDLDGLPALRGRTAVINQETSHSGCNALAHLIAGLDARPGPFFARVKRSGGHAASLAMVARGEAEVAAIDCVTHALLARHRPSALAGTRVLGFTADAPGLPLITRGEAPAGEVAALRAGLERVLADPELATVRDELLLEGLSILPGPAYDEILSLEAQAAGGKPAASLLPPVV